MPAMATGSLALPRPRLRARPRHDDLGAALPAAAGADRAAWGRSSAAETDSGCSHRGLGETRAGTDRARLGRRARDGRGPLHGDHGRPDRHQLTDPDPRRAVASTDEISWVQTAY